MIDLAADRSAADPSGLALVDAATGRHLSWADLDRAAGRAAAQLAALGVGRGDRVVLAAPAGVGFAVVLHAAIRLGASLVPVAPGAAVAELEGPLRVCRPRVALGGGDALIRLAAAVLAIEAQEAPVAVHDLDQLTAGGGLSGPEAARARGRRRGLRLADEICVVHTSGTTGRPKGVRLTLGNQIASARGCAESLGLRRDDHWLLLLAPHHVGGLAVLLRSAVLGHPVSVLPRFDETAALAVLAGGDPTVLPLVPTMLTRLVAAGGTDRLRRLRAILLGGAPARPSDVADWVDQGLRVCPSYGLTETGSQVATVPPGRAGSLGAAAGLAHRFARVRILAEGGARRPVAAGRPGRIEVSGPVVSPGYVEPDPAGGPGRGRFVTRDRGWLDPHGVLHLIGRADDAILSGGETIQPEEVERVLLRHPLIADAAVAGVPDPVWGQRLVAVLVARPGGREQAEREVSAHCRAALSGARVPRSWCWVDRLPRSEAGKLLRRELVRLTGGDGADRVTPAGR